MTRYVSRPRAGLIEDPDHGVAATAHEILTGDDFIETGLLDMRGQPLVRRRDHIRLGFKEGS